MSFIPAILETMITDWSRGARRWYAPILALALVAVPLGGHAEVREGRESVNIVVTTNGRRELPPEDQTRQRVFTHEEAPSHRWPVPTCQSTQNDQVEAYRLGGWHLPTGGISYLVDDRRAPRGIQAGAEAALAAGAATWTAADGDKLLTFSGNTKVFGPRYDGNNVILWRALYRGIVAQAYIWYHPLTEEVLDVDLVFNSRVPWALSDPAAGDCGGVAGAYDVRSIAVHEFGHWIGLDDLYESATVDLTMYGLTVPAELKKATLGAGDVLGAQAVAP